MGFTTSTLIAALPARRTAVAPVRPRRRRKLAVARLAAARLSGDGHAAQARPTASLSEKAVRTVFTRPLFPTARVSAGVRRHRARERDATPQPTSDVWMHELKRWKLLRDGLEVAQVRG